MRKNETIAYLARLIDGEGYVGIKKTNGRSDCINAQYHERIQVRMVDEPAIRLLSETLGGKYYRETEHSKYSKRPLYCYQASDKCAANAIRKLWPYLTIKKAQAHAILELRKSKDSPRSHQRGNGQGPMKPDIIKFRESLYQRIKAIHHPA